MSLLTSRALMSQWSIVERSDITVDITPALQDITETAWGEDVDELQEFEPPAQNYAMVRSLMALSYS